MANRRMFAKSVTDSDEFLELPYSAQALYFHIGMQADDDGYCGKVSISRLTKCQPNDIQLLVDAEFIYPANDKVLFVIHWKENNQLRKDRYKPSKHEELHGLATNGLPDGNQRLTQVRLGKVRLGKKDTVENDSIPYKEILEYLNKVTGKNYRCGKKNNEHIRARWNEGHRVDDFKKVIDIKDEEWRDDPKMAKFRRPSTLFGTKFDEYLNQTAGDKPTRTRSPEVEAALANMFKMEEE